MKVSGLHSACHMSDPLPLQVIVVGHTVNQSLTPENSAPRDKIARKTFLSLAEHIPVYLK